MKEILKELDGAFQMISIIPVSGEAVDAMAVARNKLRQVHAELKKMDEDANGRAGE